MYTVCIRYAVAMYCLTRYINVFQTVCLYDYYYYYEYLGKTLEHIAHQIYESFH